MGKDLIVSTVGLFFGMEKGLAILKEGKKIE